jgi:hypothetical protein
MYIFMNVYIGFYALAGVLYRCPAGYYGVSEGMSVQYCSGPCYAGIRVYICVYKFMYVCVNIYIYIYKCIYIYVYIYINKYI